MKTIRIASFEPIAKTFRRGPDMIAQRDAIEPPIEVTAVDHNTVQITIGSTSRVVDAVSLRNAIEEAVAFARGER